MILRPSHPPVLIRCAGPGCTEMVDPDEQGFHCCTAHELAEMRLHHDIPTFHLEVLCGWPPCSSTVDVETDGLFCCEAHLLADAKAHEAGAA